MAEENTPEVMYKLGRIESLVEELKNQFKTWIDDSAKKYDNHENRISKLEKQNIKIYTAASVIGGVGAAIVEVFKWLSSH